MLTLTSENPTTSLRALLIDNYDSFSYNLVQLLGPRVRELVVLRNDEKDLSQLEEIGFDCLVVSPGPGRPENAGISCEAINRFGLAMGLPVLGVCLGHQAIASAMGGRIVHAPYLAHGVAYPILHFGSKLLQGLPNPFLATRYHSLVVEKESLPADLHVTAQTEDGLVMALEHASLPIFGVQFHPESVLCSQGPAIIEQFVTLAAKVRAKG